MPLSRTEIDTELNRRKGAITSFKRNVILATLGELSVMALAYVAAFSFFDLGDNLGIAIAVALIGPGTALICIAIATSLRYRELLDKLHAYLPPETSDAAASLKGRNSDVDSYLKRIAELGRELTQAEFVKLERHCKTYG